jgi:hypothetical protein
LGPEIPADVSDFVKATAVAIVAGDWDARANFDNFCTAVARVHTDWPAALRRQLDTEMDRAKNAAAISS